MSFVSADMWMLLGLGAISGLCLCSSLASRLGLDVEIHHLRLETMRLREEYEKRVAHIRSLSPGAAHNGEPIEVSSIE